MRKLTVETTAGDTFIYSGLIGGSDLTEGFQAMPKIGRMPTERHVPIRLANSRKAAPRNYGSRDATRKKRAGPCGRVGDRFRSVRCERVTPPKVMLVGLNRTPLVAT